MKQLFFLSTAISIFISIVLSAPVYAQENNKVGIHIASVEQGDVADASTLVNTNGDWGYMTLVIREDERDVAKVQALFDQMREKHLIPIVRIATRGEGSAWRVPGEGEADEWANFLNSLRWVTKERYVILFNEPNHATEWGGSVNPEEYARVALTFSTELKERNNDFFVMLGGLDLTAPDSGTQYMDAGSFYARLFASVPASEWKGKINGIASHSYPNPGFGGNVWDTGKSSIRGYEWELAQYVNYGVGELQVFITETGWKLGATITPEDIARYMEEAYRLVWLPDNRVRAVTPFILNYQSEPFAGFSWKKSPSEYYPVYGAIKNMEKKHGTPSLYERVTIITPLPSTVTADSTIYGTVIIRNDGESIIDGEEGSLLISQNPIISFSQLPRIKPGETGKVSYTITSDQEGTMPVKIFLKRNDVTVQELTWNIRVVPSISLRLFVTLLFSGLKPQSMFEVQLFDKENHLVYQRGSLTPNSGVLELGGVTNVVLGEEYRVVVLRPYYLPRQEIVRIQENTEIKVKPMLPIDFNNDGKFSKEDLIPWTP